MKTRHLLVDLKQNKALEFQACGLYSGCKVAFIIDGPNSNANPHKLEHPGPPLSQITKGSFWGHFYFQKPEKVVLSLSLTLK